MLLVFLYVAGVKKKRDKLARTGRDAQKLANYLEQPFSILRVPRKRKTPDNPEHDDCPAKVCVPQTGLSTAEKSTQMSSGKLETKNMQRRIRVLENKVKQLKQENKRLHQRNEVLRDQLAELCPKRVNQIVKRKTESVTRWKQRYQNAIKSSAARDKNIKELTEVKQRLKKLKKSRDRSHKRYIQKKKQEALKLPAEKYISQLVEKKKEVEVLKLDRVYMEHELDKSMQSDDHAVPTMLDGKTFAPSIREASYKLQSLGVAESSVSEAIQSVVHIVTQKDIGRLPSASTQHKLGPEMLALSRQQVKEGLSEIPNTTLKYDGTTKKGIHLTELEVSTGERTYLAGIRRQCSGTAGAYVESISESLASIDGTKTPGGETAASNILSNVANTMTDRYVVLISLKIIQDQVALLADFF